MRLHDNVSQVGFDVHRRFSMTASRDNSGRLLCRERLDHGDREQFRKRLSQWPAGTPVILEATFGWGWMCDELRQAGLEPHLASSRKVAGWRKGRGLSKTNKIDAELLSELWDQKPQMRGGVMHRWWEVWLAPQQVRDRRELLRHRMGLVQMQTALKNRIHATLHRHGILHEFSDLFGGKGRRLLSVLVQDEQALRETARQTLKQKLMLLDVLRRLIAKATSQFRMGIKTCEMAQRLQGLPGVSVVLSYTIAAEIGQIDRFPKPRQLIRYSLLAPEADDSGEQREGKPIGRHIGHAGRQTLQWAWIEAAHGAVIKDPQMRAIWNRRTDKGRKDRGAGYIAVAHTMCKIAHAMLRNGTDYQPVRPRRPGSRTEQSDSSRPGTGQPLASMAACIETAASSCRDRCREA